MAYNKFQIKVVFHSNCYFATHFITPTVIDNSCKSLIFYASAYLNSKANIICCIYSKTVVLQ